jgi:thiol-disulfide isomerase/thioredoxin|tara:strand:+ start:828 stop:1421 length:594 start_codon:yes stop_codon:yes gene_type:complete
MINLFFYLFLLGCPAELETANTKDTSVKSTAPIEPPELGVNERDDCDQKAIGSNVCNLVLYDQNGELWELYDHKGKVVVLDFSTSWCYPCQVAGMHAQPLYDDYGGNVEFVTVLVDGFTHSIPPTEDEINSWVENHNISTAPILRGSREYVFDPMGITGYLIGGFPTYVFIDKEMKIHTGAVGFNEQYVRTIIDGLL